MPTTVTKPIILDETGQDLVTQLTRIADAKEASVLSFGGSVLFANLPSPTVNNLNYFYRIIDAFTTTTDFVVGAGVSMPAGSYFAVIDVGTSDSHVYKYDELGNIVDMDSKQDKIMTNSVVVHGTTQTRVEDAIAAINNGTGSLTNLTTTDKSNLVAAINEAASTGSTVDQTYDSTSTNAQSGTAVAGAVADLYSTGDTAETTLADNDYVPFYDTSATAKRKSTWSNIKSVLKNYFDGVYSTTKTSEPAASGGTDLSLVTTGEKNTWNNKISDNPSFSQASSRANIASGESFSTILGKIMKWFTDLADLAFISKNNSTSNFLRGDGTWVTPPNTDTLSGLTDTTISSASNGQALLYDSSASKWKNQNLPAGGHTMSPTPSSSVTESDVVSAVSGASNTNNNVASLFGVGNWSNVLRKRVLYSGSIAQGATGIGYWPDATELTALEAMSVSDRATKEGSGTGNYGWWYNAAFKDPNVASGLNDLSTDDNTDVAIMFDPYAGKESLVLGGYIIDTDTGYMCIKFGKGVGTATHRVGVDLTITRNNVG